MLNTDLLTSDMMINCILVWNNEVHVVDFLVEMVNALEPCVNETYRLTLDYL